MRRRDLGGEVVARQRAISGEGSSRDECSGRVMIVFSSCFWTADQTLSDIVDIMTCASFFFEGSEVRESA